MNLNRLVALALSVTLLAGCGDGVDAADKSIENLKAASKKLVDDISDLSMEEVQQEASEFVAGLVEKLQELNDTEQVQQLRKTVEPAIDRLVAMKDELGEDFRKSPEVQIAIGRVKEQFAEGSEMRAAIDPFLEKLEALFN